MYFNKGHKHLQKMMAIIESKLATLPQIEQGKETKQVCVIISHLNCTITRILEKPHCLLGKKFTIFKC